MITDRWKMNRIGFVNFWLYDEEEFLFQDGKLLLRGQNGSGKSIATQSMIPFILDGDRTPSRLDPFGSSDRKMDYYFLGEDEKDDSTGYIFLEFIREESGQFRTLVIGQRARKGKPMTFWGSVIMDNRRIGRDIQLYRQVGSSRIPLDKQEMKKLMGENTPFTDEPGKYKAMVNQYIFGFSKMEQYEQFIRLLIKVRAPKLSKEFRPTRVYEILNESLQTLTDADMRPMVDAMEKMDQIQESLESLKRACKDTEAIRSEYIRYNQFFLGKKAENYLSVREKRIELQKEAESQRKKRKSLEDQENSALNESEKLREDLGRIEAELNTLLSANSQLEDLEQKITSIKKEQEAAEDKKTRYQKRIEESREKILEYDGEIHNLQGHINDSEEKLEQNRQEQNEIQESLQWDGHSQVVAFLEDGVGDYSAISGAISRYQKQLGEAKDKIQENEKAEARYSEALEESEKIHAMADLQEYHLEEIEKKATDEKDRLITEMYTAQKTNQEFLLPADLLPQIEENISDYQSPSQGRKTEAVFFTQYNTLREKRRDHQADLNRKQKEIQSAGKELEKELEIVCSMQDLEPDRTQLSLQNRKRLEAEGISALPFYKCLEFREDLLPEECGAIEHALQDSGLLDALVIAQEQQEKAKQILPEYEDRIIRISEKISGISEEFSSDDENGFSLFLPADDLDQPLYHEVCRILSSIRVSAKGDWEKESDCFLRISKGGDYLQGVLDGHATASGEASFVGRLARKQRREKKIAELTAALEEIRKEEENLNLEMSQEADRLETLQKEYAGRIRFDGIDQFLEEKARELLRLDNLRQQVAKADDKLSRMENEKNRAYQVMLSVTRPLPYERTKAAYEEAISDCESYFRVWYRLYDYYNKVQQLKERMASLQEKQENEEQKADEDRYELKGMERKLTEYRISLEKLEEILNSPELVECAKRIEVLRESEKSATARQFALNNQIISWQTEQKLLEENSRKTTLQVNEVSRQENIVREYFREELQLELLMHQGTRELFDCAKEAAGLVRASDQNRSGEQLTAALFTTFYKYTGSLDTYGATLESCFETEEGESTGTALRARKRISFVWSGKKLYFEEFYKALRMAIEETELLIQQKDRELFENILSQTISAQLTERIADSRKWVKDMSSLMKKLDTSMGLHFSLEWKPLNSEASDQLDTSKLENLLLRDKELLTEEDIDKVARHFRSKINDGKQTAVEAGLSVNYMDLVRDVLDYRKWFAFQMYYYKENDGRKPLTNAAFNRFSGGEKAMAMYVPLFAAVNAQYQKAQKADHPRIIALDEAFAGVDDKNISSMFELIEKMDFDYILNSQTIWGCYDTVKNLGISELHRPKNSSIVTVIRYIWNGHIRILADQ